ncbi:MAG TPA: helix-turn-helix domain-containing protein [Deltaproteobacteria bacterium]|nr:helix-turn-helix domain-containing protein [Deltaproteobacteria bacterium]
MYEPSISLMSVLLLIGAAQAVFLFLVLFRSAHANNPANRTLALLLLVLALSLTDGFLAETNYYGIYPWLIGLEWPTNFLYGPLIYLYTRSMVTRPGRAQRGRTWPHFIPAAMLFVYLVPLYLMDPARKALWWRLTGGLEKAASIRDLDPVILAIVLQMAIYIALSVRALLRHAARLTRGFSSVEDIDLRWMTWFLVVFSVLWAGYTFYTLFSQFSGLYRQAGYGLHLLVACAVFYLGYKGLKQPGLFAVIETLEAMDAAAAPAAPAPPSKGQAVTSGPGEGAAEKYRKSALDRAKAEEILSGLTRLMDEQKPFLEMGLTLPVLADMLSVSTNHLSQAINMGLQKNFFDFVNSYRVREAQRLLASPEADKLSILGIGMEAGFSSKSAFYNAFRKHVGMTPSQYRDSLTLSS